MAGVECQIVLSVQRVALRNLDEGSIILSMVNPLIAQY